MTAAPMPIIGVLGIGGFRGLGFRLLKTQQFRRVGLRTVAAQGGISGGGRRRPLHTFFDFADSL